MCFNYSKKNLFVYIPQGWFQDFKLGGGAFKKIVPSGGRRENFWCISCEKSRFYAQKSYFFPILGGTPWIHPSTNPLVLEELL
jgi:hypothetical protein